MEEKVMQDRTQRLGWQSYILIGLGVLIGIVMVSLLKHHEINLVSIGRATGFAITLFFAYILLRQGAKRVEQNR